LLKEANRLSVFAAWGGKKIGGQEKVRETNYAIRALSSQICLIERGGGLTGVGGGREFKGAGS